MTQTREQKEKVVSELKERIDRQITMVFVDFSGLKARDVFDLRRKLEEKNSELKVAKKTLFCIAIQEFSSSLLEKVKKMEGQLGIVFGYQDPISPAKTLYNFSKENESLTILGGFFEDRFIEKEKVVELGKIPTRKELYSKLVYDLSAPMSKLVNVFQNNLKGLMIIFNKVKAK